MFSKTLHIKEGKAFTCADTFIWKHLLEVLRPLSPECISTINSETECYAFSQEEMVIVRKRSKLFFWKKKNPLDERKLYTFKFIHEYSFQSFNFHFLFLCIVCVMHAINFSDIHNVIVAYNASITYCPMNCWSIFHSMNLDTHPLLTKAQFNSSLFLQTKYIAQTVQETVTFYFII